MQVLLDAGADVRARSEGSREATALHYAGETGDLQLVKVLISAGACVEALDHQGKTALDWAQHPESQWIWRHKRGTPDERQQVAASLESERTASKSERTAIKPRAEEH